MTILRGSLEPMDNRKRVLMQSNPREVKKFPRVKPEVKAAFEKFGCDLASLRPAGKEVSMALNFVSDLLGNLPRSPKK